MAWRCCFLTTRRSQHGRIITEKRVSEELSGAPDAPVDFHTAVDGSISSCETIASPMNVLQTMTLSVRVRSRSTQGVRNSQRNSPLSNVASDFSARSREMPRVCNNGGALGRGHAASSTDERSAVFEPRGDDRGAALRPPRPAFCVVKLGSCSAVHLTSSVIIVSSLAAVIFAVAVTLACDARVESGF